MPDKEIQKVVDKNFEAFTQKLPELLNRPGFPGGSYV